MYYGYTRACSDTYIKLIYLRSRVYDPAAGRFTTKDSWQGDYNRPLSLNRWNYGYGNPVNLTDPTGLFPAECLEAPNFAQCLRDWLMEIHFTDSSIEDNGDCLPDPVSLSHVGDPVPGRPDATMIYGGDQFAKLYELMDSATGTWWNRDGEFTFEQYVGLLLMHEGSGNYLFSMLDAFAGAQQVYVGGGAKGAYGPYCPSKPCRNGVFNYFAAYSQSARGLVETYVKGGADIRTYTGYGGRGPGQTTRVMKEADEYGSAMLHPTTHVFHSTNPTAHVTWSLDNNPNSGLSDYGFALQRRFILLRHVEYYYDVSESKKQGKTRLFRRFKTS